MYVNSPVCHLAVGSSFISVSLSVINLLVSLIFLRSLISLSLNLHILKKKNRPAGTIMAAVMFSHFLSNGLVCDYTIITGYSFRQFITFLSFEFERSAMVLSSSSPMRSISWSG